MSSPDAVTADAAGTSPRSAVRHADGRTGRHDGRADSDAAPHAPSPSGSPSPADTSPPSDTPSPTGTSPRPTSLAAEHLRPTLKFLAVGGAVFLFDAAMYNLLVFWDPGSGWGHGLMHGQPLIAKLLTIAVASCLTYLGNRLWTFGDRPRPRTARSIALFILVNVIAAGLQLGCLGFSRYVLGLDSVLADNISGTFIGQIVSTSFRYVTYGRFVFPKER
ncbi:GtrA family protein [Brachybacterium muris]|uniref:GtrA family protein n=1 Tax=Brachybacterium muris TaxID=219301 RepID=UPI00223BEF4F|nr:GtrA family protein [Brachybacterium muris]